MSSSEKKVGEVRVVEALRLDAITVTAGDLTVEGVFVLDAEVAAMAPRLLLENGLQLHGLSVRDGGADVTSSSEGWLLTIHAASGSAMLVDESAQVIADPDDRFAIKGGTNGLISVDERPVQVIYNGAAGRWWAPDWSSTHRSTYVSDGIATQVIETFPVVPEGYGMGIDLQVTMLADDGADGYASNIHISGSAHRRTAAATTVFASAPTASGDLPGAAVSLTVSANAVEVRVLTTLANAIAVTWNRTFRLTPLS